MAKARLLQAVCTVAILGAAPAFAQTATRPAETGAGNTPNAPVAHDGKSWSSRHATGAMHARADTSQNAAVDQLNDQSYQAAQQGQAFSSPNSRGMTSGGAGNLSDMPPSARPSSGASGTGGGPGSGGGTGSK